MTHWPMTLRNIMRILNMYLRTPTNLKAKICLNKIGTLWNTILPGKTQSFFPFDQNCSKEMSCLYYKFAQMPPLLGPIDPISTIQLFNILIFFSGPVTPIHTCQYQCCGFGSVFRSFVDPDTDPHM